MTRSMKKKLKALIAEYEEQIWHIHRHKRAMTEGGLHKFAVQYAHDAMLFRGIVNDLTKILKSKR